MLYYLEPNDLDMDNKMIKIPNSLKDKLMLIMIKAKWCGHCNNTNPKFIEAAKKSLKNDKDVLFCFADVTADFGSDKTQNLPSKFFDGFRGYPHLVLFKNGKEVAKYDGNRSPESLLEFINKNKN
jgi:thiol-disulfide isomerase/thioredoxin